MIMLVPEFGFWPASSIFWIIGRNYERQTWVWTSKWASTHIVRGRITSWDDWCPLTSSPWYTPWPAPTSGNVITHYFLIYFFLIHHHVALYKIMLCFPKQFWFFNFHRMSLKMFTRNSSFRSLQCWMAHLERKDPPCLVRFLRIRTALVWKGLKPMVNRVSICFEVQT